MLTVLYGKILIIYDCYILVIGQMWIGYVGGEMRQRGCGFNFRLHPCSTWSPISDEQMDRRKMGGNEADIQNEVQTELVRV